MAFGPDEEPLPLDTHTRTYDLELSHTRTLGTRNILTYGGNLRRDAFHVNLAPAAEDYVEFGGYLQDEFFLGGGPGRSEWRISAGGRVDKFGNIDGLVLSPRLSVLWKPDPNHSFRFSFNRGFRSPSSINNYLDAVVIKPIDLAPYFPDLPPQYLPAVAEDFNLQQRVLGTPSLHEEALTSYELGYIGTVLEKT